jgi:hypothetical protein
MLSCEVHNREKSVDEDRRPELVSSLVAFLIRHAPRVQNVMTREKKRDWKFRSPTPTYTKLIVCLYRNERLHLDLYRQPDLPSGSLRARCPMQRLCENIGIP